MCELSAKRIAQLSGRSENEIVVLREVGSTNTELKRLAADGAGEGLVLLADGQTAGRGRMGRSFFSPPGSGLYFSILCRPRALDPGRLTTLAAVIAAEALSEVCDIEADIKWVNDLYVNGKKLCGILAEGVGRDFAVVGIGINTAHAAFPRELASTVTGVEDITGRVPDRNALAAALIRGFDRAPREGYAHMDEYRRRSYLIGREVLLPSGESVCVLGIEDSGALIVLQNEKRLRIATGEVSVKPI